MSEPYDLPRNFTNSRQFCQTVRMLRGMHERYRHMALYAATFWDDERLLEAEAAGDLPGNDGALSAAGRLQ